MGDNIDFKDYGFEIQKHELPEAKRLEEFDISIDFLPEDMTFSEIFSDTVTLTDAQIESLSDEAVQREITEELQEEKNRLLTADEYMAYLRSLAENDPQAMNALGYEFFLRDDIDGAMRCFENAAEKDYAAAKRNLAIMLEGNESEDKEEIFELYDEAAKQEDVIALNNLGCCYMNGEGTAVDYKKAVECFKKAADLNDTLAIVNLAGCYSLGAGIKQNLKKAFELYRQGAETGNITAIRSLADCYLKGDGTKQNLDEAVKLYKTAAEQGDSLSAEKLKEINARLTPERHGSDTLDNVFEAARAARQNQERKTAEQKAAEQGKSEKESPEKEKKAKSGGERS